MKNMRRTLLAVSFAAAISQLVGCSTPQVDTEQYLTDKDITDKVKMAIVSDPMTRDSDITVSTINNIVHLKGMVASQATADRAGQLARGASGAMGVKNELGVK